MFLRQYRRRLISKEVCMYYDDNSERERCLKESVSELEKLNKKLSQLMVRKEELTSMIIDALGHEHEGQKTYEYGEWKIEVKTPCVYSLNKKCYEENASKIPSQFNPVKESVSYSIDKRLCEQYLNDAPFEVKSLLIDLIEKKPGKAGITIKGIIA